MKCYTCKERMKCVSDVNDVGTRLDFLECPKCGSKATVEYDTHEGYITKVNWKR